MSRISRFAPAGVGLAIAVILPAGAIATRAVTPPPPNLFAKVSSGTLVAGTATGVTVLGVGRYEVAFNRTVKGCGFVATTEHTASQALQAYTAGGHNSENDVYVEVKNQGGGLTDGSFDLLVDCGAAGEKFAVVNYGGTLQRSSGGTLTHLGTGRYDISFTSDISSCAYLATVGDPGNALVFNPAGVYTSSGPDAKTVYVETKNPGGGLTDGIPFHLDVVCSSVANVKTAVVISTGIISRGTGLTSSLSTGTGEYAIATSRDITKCATVLTRGMTDTAVPFTPSTVEVTHPYPAVNTVGVEVRQLLFFGGAPESHAFHAAIVC
jgi:hypothetical protein